MFEFEVDCQIPSQNVKKIRFAEHIFKEFFGKFQKNNY